MPIHGQKVRIDMPTNTRSKPPAFTVAPTPSLANDLIDKLVAFEPMREETVDTKLGPSDAVIARVVEVADDGTFSDLGEHPIFWMVVRRQLVAGKEDAPWVVGRLIRAGQAYRLEAPTVSEMDLFAKVLSKVDGS
jgi:hypothetical protein